MSIDRRQTAIRQPQSNYNQFVPHTMFDIKLSASGQIVMTGRLDATECEAALKFLGAVPEPRVIDLAGLDYIASAGLRVLLITQKRLKGAGGALKLINVQPRIFDIFRYAGFDRIIEIETAST